MKRFLLVSLIVFSIKLPAQSLVANGDFEDVNICTEYRKDCAPEAWVATSLFWNYYFDPRHKMNTKAAFGEHFVGLTAGSINYPGSRNFVRTRLLCGLHAGHQYQLSFYTYANFAILDSIGVYFSANDFLGIRGPFKQVNPQLWSKDVITEPIPPAQWRKLQFTYTADGTEGYMTIGNFKREDYKGILKGEIRYEYLFFIDSVALIPLSPTEKLCPQADSVQQEIYAEDYRHNYLDKKIYWMRRKPPEIMALPKTTIPKAKRVLRIDTLVVPDIFFATGSAHLTNASFPMLDSLAYSLYQAHFDSVVVEGHTDSIGKLAYNKTLSLDRAKSVKQYLGDRAPAVREHAVTRGWAYLKPVADNATPEGRRQNRRVAIFIYRKE